MLCVQFSGIFGESNILHFVSFGNMAGLAIVLHAVKLSVNINGYVCGILRHCGPPLPLFQIEELCLTSSLAHLPHFSVYVPPCCAMIEVYK